MLSQNIVCELSMVTIYSMLNNHCVNKLNRCILVDKIIMWVISDKTLCSFVCLFLSVCTFCEFVQFYAHFCIKQIAPFSIHRNSFLFIWSPDYILYLSAYTALFLSEVTVCCLLHGFQSARLLIHAWCTIAWIWVGTVTSRRRRLFRTPSTQSDSRQSITHRVPGTNRLPHRLDSTPDWLTRVMCGIFFVFVLLQLLFHCCLT